MQYLLQGDLTNDLPHNYLRATLSIARPDVATDLVDVKVDCERIWSDGPCLRILRYMPDTDEPQLLAVSWRWLAGYRVVQRHQSPADFPDLPELWPVADAVDISDV